MPDLKPCPFCGGEIEERGAQCNYGKKIMTLDLMCKNAAHFSNSKASGLKIHIEKLSKHGTAVLYKVETRFAASYTIRPV